MNLAALHYAPGNINMALLAIVVAVAAYYDLRSGIVPNWLSYPAVAAALAVSFGFGGTAGLFDSAGGLLVAFVPMLCFWLMGAIGGGDVKLLAAVGAWSNWRFVIAVMAVSFAVIALWAVLVLIKRRIFWQTVKKICRTVFLAAVSGGKSGWSATAADIRLPFAVAVALAVAAVCADALTGLNLLVP